MCEETGGGSFNTLLRGDAGSLLANERRQKANRLPFHPSLLPPKQLPGPTLADDGTVDLGLSNPQ